MNKLPKEEYLSEDQDLLKELEEVGPMSTGQALSEQQRKISIIEIKSILRNRKTASDSNESTAHFSTVLLFVALVQVVVALSQFLFETATSEHKAHAIA